MPPETAGSARQDRVTDSAAGFTPYFVDDLVTLYNADCLDVLRTLPDCSVDAVVTDPPYGLGFMGKAWDSDFIAADVPMRRNPAMDAVNAGASRQGGRQRASEDYQRRQARDARSYQAWCEQWARECLRVLKPGGHMLAFGGTRTAHRLACAIEDAGFELRDTIAWLYGSGFPKSMNVAKAITATQTVGSSSRRANRMAMTGDDSRSTSFGSAGSESSMLTERSTPPPLDNLTADAERWQGWGTALKPAHEPIIVARKLLAGTVAANVLAQGTGALNIDGCRVEFVSATDERESKDKNRHADFGTEPGGNAVYGDFTMVERKNYDAAGRWPTNVVLDPDAAAELDRQSGNRPGMSSQRDLVTTTSAYFGADKHPGEREGYNDQGGASRFFPVFRYEAKAPADERPKVGAVAHPTVKPLDLMRWLVRLVTPPGGLVLEPFAGSGTTAEACIVEGFRCIAIEREADYLPLILARITKPIEPVMFGMEAS